MAVTYDGLLMIAESAYSELGLYPHADAVHYAAECGLVCDTYDEAELLIQSIVDIAADSNEMEL